ncbi:glycoside hydrolase family 9 protein [Brevibacillus sp. AY1]|uniref:glycoside hydrolase family 9 protein n=1 Tax=Brevibacillus sp. AY1 TaxID=2807621 RepID=UPI002455BABA|nr:glycoside hydrolase family 9 protein [Brevibacillus sp. AY1]MDH4617110.1 glycoside hydrolase family 9 protein [Brevibacillus sp. AY1]
MVKGMVHLLRWRWLLLLLALIIAGLFLIQGQRQEPPPMVAPLPVTREISVNQVGYAPDAIKMASTTLPASEFTLVDLADHRVVYRGVPKSGPQDGQTGKPVYQLDFSTFQKPGTYQIHLSNGLGSAPFQISDNVFESIFRMAMRSYELQRCGVAIDDPISHVNHEACHTLPAILSADGGGVRDVTGGWHDAGDYGKYMPNAGMTVASLLLLQELTPGTLKHSSLSLHREKRDEPDVLAVIRVELDWMRKMQREDGAVYHSVKTAEFPGMIRPEEDQEIQYVEPIATPDTAIYAAAMARAARVYQAYDADYAKILLNASMQAWRFLEGNEEILVPGKDQAYRSKSDSQSRVWAAAELYVTTSLPLFRKYVEEHYSVLELRPKKMFPAYWQNTSAMTILTLALNDQSDWELPALMRQRLIQHADRVAATIEQRAYGTILNKADDFDWASAKNTLGYGVHLASAHKLEPKPAYIHAIIRQLDWVLGSNALSQSFVTGMGMFSPVEPHHRYTVASGILIPGLLVGGPNSHANDGIAPKRQGALSYVDDHRSYATNEYAIDYNAPLVIVASYLNEVYN